MCLSIPTGVPVTCRSQQSYAFRLEDGTLLAAYRTTAVVDPGVKTLAYVVRSTHLPAISSQAEVPCLADVVQSNVIIYRSLCFTAPSPTPLKVQSTVVERTDGSHVLAFPLTGLTETAQLAPRCLRSVFDNPESHGLQLALFGEAFRGSDVDLDDLIMTHDGVRCFFVELLEALHTLWTPGSEEALIFVVPNHPRRPEESRLQPAAKRQRTHGGGASPGPGAPLMELDVTLVFNLPAGASSAPLLGLKHNHPPLDTDSGQQHLFLTNMQGVAGQLRVMYGLTPFCYLDQTSETTIMDRVNAASKSPKIRVLPQRELCDDPASILCYKLNHRMSDISSIDFI